MGDSEGGRSFLSRWSNRKTQARLARRASRSQLPDGALPAVEAHESGPPQRVTEPAAKPVAEPVAQAPPAAAPDAARSPAADRSAATGANEPAPTLADVAQLTPESDFTRFVAGDVQTDVKNAALRRLFSDPHFNRMDGLDVYIDDYNAPDPLPASVLLKTAQAKFLGLMTEAEKEESAPADALKQDAGEFAPARANSGNPPADRIAVHEDADLQLQPHDDAGQPCTAAGVGRDTGREH